MRVAVLAFSVAALATTASAQYTSQAPRLECVYNCPSNAVRPNPYQPNSIANPYSSAGSPYSNTSPNNPYATQPPILVDQNGNYRGKLTSNPYDPDSVNNPYGRYGSPYSQDSVTNPYAPKAPVYVVPRNR